MTTEGTVTGAGTGHIGRRVLLATAVAGTLDIGMAAIETALHGKPITRMLRGVASGPVPAAVDWGAGGALLGLTVHYAIMAVMALVFMIAHARAGWVRAHHTGHHPRRPLLVVLAVLLEESPAGDREGQRRQHRREDQPARAQHRYPSRSGYRPRPTTLGSWNDRASAWRTTGCAGMSR